MLEHLGNAVGFPPHLLGILTRGAEEMAQMMEVYQVQLRQHVTWWRESSPLIFSWQLPSHFVKVLTAQSKDPKAFCSQHERYAQEVDSFCPPRNESRIQAKLELEGQLRGMQYWQSQIGGSWRATMLSHGIMGNANASVYVTYVEIAARAVKAHPILRSGSGRFQR